MMLMMMMNSLLKLTPCSLMFDWKTATESGTCKEKKVTETYIHTKFHNPWQKTSLWPPFSFPRMNPRARITHLLRHFLKPSPSYFYVIQPLVQDCTLLRPLLKPSPSYFCVIWTPSQGLCTPLLRPFPSYFYVIQPLVKDQALLLLGPFLKGSPSHFCII